MLESLFNPDNPLMRTINKIIDLFVLSVVLALCSLPIITISASCASLYYSVVKAVRRDRSHAVREFWHAFKSNLKRGIPAELIWLIFAFMMLVGDFPLVSTFLDTGKIQNTVMLILFAVKALILLGIACWFCPLMSRYDERIWTLLKASLSMLVRHPFISLLTIALVLIVVILLAMEPLLSAVIPGFAMFLLSLLQEPALQEICEKPADDNNTDTWYLE